jgi:hypothetical protein
MSWPADQFAGNVERQDPGRASFLNRFLANRRAASLVPDQPSRANREYGSTYPFQRFLEKVTQANVVEDVPKTGYFVRATSNTQRPSPIIGGAR